jgi:hypothetical protein|tara:strand:+ start:132 stop:848 length:717 start_codon:yes stop_codon:yes gene_type:complete
MPSFEVLLVLGIIGFYFYDAFMLLSLNELILLKSSKSWSYKFPTLGFQLLRKFPFVPNLLTPNVALFKVMWPTKDDHLDLKALDVFIKSLIPIQITEIILFFLILICLPIVAFIYGSGVKLLIVFSAVYVLIVGALIYIFTQKNNLQLTNNKFVSIAFESIVCPPFALNMVRKITLNYSIPTDPYIFSKKMFDENSCDLFITNLCKLIEENMKFFEEDSHRYIELSEYLCLIKSEKEN